MSTPFISRLVIVFAFMAMVGAGCAGAPSGTSPAPTSTAGRVSTAADAVGRVIEREPRFDGIQPFDTGLIGQSSWYEVQPGSDVEGFIVDVRVGWGDCEAGCIDEHSWVYAVSPDGTVSVVSESGPPVPADAWPSPVGAGATGIGGMGVAGPVCPVETVPPDPACAPRPVAGAVLVIRDGTGSEVARTTTGAEGSFFVELPAGDYLVEPQPVEGLMGTAGTQSVTVKEGGTATVRLDYDTGIR